MRYILIVFGLGLMVFGGGCTVLTFSNPQMLRDTWSSSELGRSIAFTVFLGWFLLGLLPLFGGFYIFLVTLKKIRAINLPPASTPLDQDAKPND